MRHWHRDWITATIFLIAIAFWCGAVVTDFLHDTPPRPQVTRTPASAPIYVNVYVYRAEDVAKVLDAARKALPAMEGAEGVKR